MSLPSDVILVDRAWVSARYSDLVEEILHPRERAVIDGFSIPKRREDWLAGRLAAKRAVQLRTSLPLRRIAILGNRLDGRAGAPSAWIDGVDPVVGFLSISHAEHLAGACFRDEPVGLDLEVVSQRPKSFIELVFTEAERERFAGLEDAHLHGAVTEAWCRKEALSKRLGTGFGLPFSQLSLDAPGVKSGVLENEDHRMAWAFAA